MNALVKVDRNLAQATKELANVMTASEFVGPELSDAIDEALRQKCSADLAATVIERLLGLYPDRKLADEGVFTVGLMQVLTGYPAALVMRLADPLHGLPSQSVYFPSVPDCSVWLRKTLAEIEAKRARALALRRPRLAPPEPDRRALKSEAERREFVRQALAYRKQGG
jgi:hypothetical protein